jgi:predicted dehydrogenase
MQDKIIRVGIIGFGLSGRVFHAPFLDIHPGFSIVKVVERHGSKSQEIYPYVEVVKEFKNVIQDPEVDLVFICIPNNLHYSQAIECLNAGKHVVIEKPFTTTSAEADELIKLSESTRRMLFVYHNRRWDGDFLTIKQILAGKYLGEIKEFEAHFDRFRPEFNASNWKDENLAGAGILYDLGSHLIDQAMQLFGKPQSLFADIRKQRTGSPVDDYFDLQLHYEGFKAVLKAGMMVKISGPRYIINGSKGSFVKYGIDPQEAALKNGTKPDSKGWGKEPVENHGHLVGVRLGNPVDENIATLPGNYSGFYENVYQVLVNGDEMAVKPSEARDVIRVIELAYESAEKKKMIEFSY